MSRLETPSPPAPPAATAPRPVAALVLTATSTTVFAASAAPTPIYALYQQAWGLGPAMLSLVFAVYAVALLGAMLVFGRLSDHLGRRVVILAGLCVSLLAMALFLRAESAGMLIAARAVQGLAAGAITGALGAAITEASPKRGGLLNGIAPFAGMGLGAIGSAALVSWAPAPLHLVYALVAGLQALQILAILPLADTVEPEADAVARARASLRPSLHVPPAVRAPLLRLVPVNVAGWALGGFYLSLGPALARAVTGIAHPMIGGLTVGAITFGATLAVVLAQRMAVEALLPRGAMALLAGVLVTLGSVHAGLVAGLFAGTAIGGLGMGFIFRAALGSLLPKAAPHERAGVLSVYFTISYLAFSLPAIAAALLTQALGLRLATDLYGSALTLLAATTLVLLRSAPVAVAVATKAPAPAPAGCPLAGRH